MTVTLDNESPRYAKLPGGDFVNVAIGGRTPITWNGKVAASTVATGVG